MSSLEAFKALWLRIYLPNSAYPDVEVGYVLEVMATVLTGDTETPVDLAERWILCWLQVLGRPACLLDIRLAYERVHSHPRRFAHSPGVIPLEDLERLGKEADKEADRAIKALATAGLIRDSKGEWAPV
jgi:hypothetical protein